MFSAFFQSNDRRVFISPSHSIRSLSHLSLDRNPLPSLKFLSGFSSLKSLSLYESGINDFDSIDSLRNLPVLSDLRLQNTPLQVLCLPFPHSYE
jgi:hypothetical protein